MLYTFFLHSQSPQIDSLYIELQNAKEDTLKIIQLNRLSKAFQLINLDTAKTFAQKALKLSEKNDYSLGIGKSNYNLSNIFYYTSKYDTALIFANKAMQMFKKLDSKINIAKNNNTIGNIYDRQNEYQLAIQHYNKTLQYAKENKDLKLEMIVENGLGNISNHSGDYKNALEHYLKCLDISNKLNHLFAMSSSLYNIGYIHEKLENYKNALYYYKKALKLNNESKDIYRTSITIARIGFIYSQQSQFDKAIENEYEAIKISNQVGATENIAEAYMILGFCYHSLNKQDSSIYFYKKALVLIKNFGDERYLSACYQNIAASLMAKNDYINAIEHLKKSIKLNIENNIYGQLSDSYVEIAKAYQKIGDFKNAAYNYNKHNILSDSLDAQDSRRQIIEMEIKYQVKEKEAQLELQKTQLDLNNTKILNQKYQNIATAIIAFLLLLTAILVFINLQRRKQTNIKLKSLDKAKNRFFANISHELRSPLTLILAPLEGLIERTKKTTDLAELKLMKSNSKKMLNLINEILNLSKLESGKLKLNETPVNLYNLCNRIFSSFQSLANFKLIKTNFSFEIDKDLTVDLDIEKFEKILNNLISNAMKYSFSKGSVSMKVTKIKKLLKFEIKDTGKGIHPDDLPKIFNRYYQSEHSSEPILGGAGIGLSIAQEFANALKGKIEVKSVFGEFSNFTFTLPLKKAAKTIRHQEGLTKKAISIKTANLPHFKPVLIEGKKPKVLIVEDEIQMNHYLQQIIGESYDFKAVPDGEEALRILKKEHFDIITSDVMMPNMDGFEFKKIVQQNPNWKRIPFIMLTARTLEEDKLKGFQLGVDDYITKPFSVKELLVRIHNLLLNKYNRDKWDKENLYSIEESNISVEEVLLKKAEEAVTLNINKTNFSVADLANHLNYSNRQLERIIKKYTGLTPIAFIREIKLQKAFSILKKKKFLTILEVSYDVGFESPAYFSRKFKERFGISPSDLNEE